MRNHAEDVSVVFPPEGPWKVIYLSPDSHNILSEVRVDTVYVIGALVDRTVKRVRVSAMITTVLHAE